MKRTLVKDTPLLLGKEIFLSGWINSKRSHGKIIFIDLQDRSGIVQIVTDEKAEQLRNQDVVEIKGLVKKRPLQMRNSKIVTGEIEIEALEINLLSKCKDLPFPIESDGLNIEEELRLKYRYLDLRRERLTKNIRERSKFVQYVREFLFKHDFCEIETPLLTKSTPEGSRDFLVPSRLQPGKFYALPQSPQQYKQLLMVAGFERYFQIARCLRDEDLRADRGFEHSQVDLEMSFVTREEIMELIEKLAIETVEKMGGKILQKPFPIFTYKEAMEKFGADKFDLRTDEQKKNGDNGFAWVVDFPFFEKDSEDKWTFTHNPFSAPKPEDKEAFLKGEIAGIKTTQYDLVWNGFEVGGGSIRSHDPKILSKVFETLGYKKKEIESKFGHMLEAFTYGVPPHGGIALGIDRWVMLLRKEKFLREVQAFPQTSKGRTAVMEAPTFITPAQKEELGIRTLIDEKSIKK